VSAGPAYGKGAAMRRKMNLPRIFNDFREGIGELSLPEPDENSRFCNSYVRFCRPTFFWPKTMRFNELR
jgi:hypothetical protein